MTATQTGGTLHDPRLDYGTIMHLWAWLERWCRTEDVCDWERRMRTYLKGLDDDDFAHALDSGWPWVAQEAGVYEVPGGVDPA